MRWRASHASAAQPSALILFLISVCLLMLSAIGCAPSKEADDPSATLWTETQQLQAEVAKGRAEIADLKSQLQAATSAAADEAEPAAEDAAEGTEAAPSPEELQAKLDQLKSATTTKAEAFYQKVIEYINESGIIEGQPRTPEQSQAFDWKAEEDIRIAAEYIDMGGDYSRAIDIYNGSLMADPENQKLLEAKAEAERLQYMDEERFSQVKKGMTQDEVQALLGTVNRRNVREYEKDNTVGWFYRREDGGAAGVFFKEKKGVWTAVVVDYNAAKPPVAGEAAAEDESE